MSFNLESVLGGSLADAVGGIISKFKLDPAKKAEFQAALDADKALLDQKQLDMQSKLEDAVSKEIESAADIIKLEAQSTSWLPKNVRPLLLLMWGLIITFNPLVAIISQFTAHPIPQVTLDPWVYKLTVIGYTGYVAARSFDKYQQSNKQQRGNMTQEQKNAERAKKAAKKVADAAAKLAKKNADKAAKVTKITEPAADPLKSKDEPEIPEVKAKPVVELGYKTNKPSSKTTDCLHQIIKSADVCLNTNTEANIQDQICSIIRQSLRAYELHVGVPFDIEIG